MLPSRYLISKKKINYKNNNIKSLEHPHRIQLKRIKWKLSWSSCYLKAAQSKTFRIGFPGDDNRSNMCELFSFFDDSFRRIRND